MLPSSSLSSSFSSSIFFHYFYIILLLLIVSLFSLLPSPLSVSAINPAFQWSSSTAISDDTDSIIITNSPSSSTAIKRGGHYFGSITASSPLSAHYPSSWRIKILDMHSFIGIGIRGDKQSKRADSHFEDKIILWTPNDLYVSGIAQRGLFKPTQHRNYRSPLGNGKKGHAPWLDILEEGDILTFRYEPAHNIIRMKSSNKKELELEFCWLMRDDIFDKGSIFIHTVLYGGGDNADAAAGIELMETIDKENEWEDWSHSRCGLAHITEEVDEITKSGYQKQIKQDL